MVHCNKKTRRSSGFTMVELMVVLAIMAILAALVGGGLIAYTRLARFEKNEANARTLFQTAQIALTRRDTAGELDDFRQKVLLNGQAGAHFDPAAQKADELNKDIYALYYDKVTDDDSDNELLRELLGDYIYDDSLLNAAICVEIDAASGQVYSVFYDTNADKLRFGETNGATNIYNRSYDHRRHDSLVGYYSAEDRVNVVELQQTKLKVKNPRLSNTETLTLSWGGDVTRDTQVQYVATAYKSTDTGKKNPLFEIEVELPAVKTNEPVPLKTRIYAADNETPVEKTLYYPLSYNKGNFVLTLDAMASADLLRSCENDSGEKANSISVTDSSLYSITRLMSGGPQDFYVTLQAKARDDYSGNYTPSTPADTNVENSLFAKEATATGGNLTYFRHLYNLRWADNWASGQTAAYTLAAQSLGATGLNWTGGSVTVYCPAQGKNFPPEAKVPSAEEAVAWPTILTLPKNVTLDGGNVTIMNLQLRGSSVSQTGRQGKAELLDRYIGLVGENNGTIKNMTLRDADVQVNVEIVTRAKGTLPLTGTTALKPLDTKDSAYRDIRAVGALCGVNTGTLQDCTLLHGTNNAYKAQVLATLHFDDDTTEKTRIPDAANKYYEHEPQGIGGLVGVAIPKNDAGTTLENLTVGESVTVAGLLVDDDTTDTTDEPGEAGEKARYTAVAADAGDTKTATRWRSVGVGGVFGTLDAGNLKTDDKTVIANAANVTGSGFVGGIAGKNAGTIDKCTVSSPALALSGLTARADSISLGAAAGVNMQDAKISETTVTLNITDNLNKYKNLGGVAGENAGGGTLLKCTYRGALGKANTAANDNITTGAANVLDTVGGIVGLNNGEVNGCSVPKITLQVMGASGLSDSQTYAEKLKSASSVGGIAGRNNSTITSCYVATAKDSGSIITARYGFVGGVAGANNGSISSSGSGAKEVTALVKQVGDWFTAGSTNDMISKLKGTAYNNIKGVDTVSKSDYGTVYTTGLSQNDLLVGLRGTTTTNGKSSGYLGGVAGFNTVNGTITGAATGKWFVYGDNTTDESKIGGMIGMNEATGEVKLLVNCAAVRRFTRTDSNKNDDDTTHRNNKNIAYVGGVIGVQQNTADDKWVISECVNLGTVFDSGSNYIGGIIASWLKNGGTIEKSFNFGSLNTNTNCGGGSGTVGGIVGFFDKPTPGGTANILSCQNHGDILSSGNWEGDKKHGANDVAGILGKVVMADGTNDYLRINIVDCVNGDVTMQCESLAAGIMGWLGPFGDGGTKIPNKVEVYIDRCRNYATDVTISLKSGDINLFAGICGNRGNGSATSASTTVTNCFALYKNTVSSNNAPIAMNRGSENIAAYGNYFMDEGYSFNDAYNKAMKLMYEKEAKKRVPTFGLSKNDNYLYGTRLYAGINNTDRTYFAAGMVNGYNLNTVDAAKCYIIQPTDADGLATIYRPDRADKKDIATILLWYGDADNSNAPSMKDITDDLIQNYYTQVLDKRGPGQVSNLTVTHKNDSSAVYGRYEVTWTAAATDGIFPDNQIQNVSHYLVTLYKVDGDSKIALEGYKDIKVYGTRYLFDADDALANAIGTGQFCVGVKAVNGTKIGDEVKSDPQYFVRPLPTPKLEIRLKKQNSGGQAYGQYLVLTNASDYQNAGNWQVTAYLMNQPNTKITLNQSKTEALIKDGLGSATRLRATATPGATATGAWMESARYDEEIGIPVAMANKNSGLVHGKAFDTKNVTMGQPVITGSTADNLSITVTLQFTADTIPNTVPNYRVMLVGKYTGDEQISNAAEDTTATNAQPLKGQYVTLAALEKPVYSSGTEFVLSNLPAVVFDGSYTDLKVISVPIDAGYPQVVTRWEITADEALKAIGEGNNNPVSWNNGIEIVRGADGKFSYYHLTPLQFFASQDSWYDMAKKQIRKDELNLTLLKAPTVSSETTSKVDEKNKLKYTFTWTQLDDKGNADTNKHDYDVTLYGLLTQKTDETTTIAGKEKIELKDGVSLTDRTTFNPKTGTYTLTLCVDDDLASGSWRYDTVQLHVTRKPGDGDTNAIGLAGEADCVVKQRLSAVGQVNSIMRTNDNSANALNYDITWPASADDKGENTVTYTLYAEKLDSNNWTALADWKGITKNSCTVDLEKYQGVTLRFYVVANAVDGKKYCSPNGEYSNLLVVEKRLAAPVVTTAKLSYQTPSQTQFLTEEKLTLTVDNSASSGSYYYMGYLFKDAADYKQIADLANNYQKAQTPDDKATCLKKLTDTLNDMLADPGRVLRLLPEGRMDGGAQAETTTDGAAFALGDESFTMKPEYAGYWLLPALRSMSTDGTTASSNWYYYVADGLSVAPTQMQLPKIKLDAPQTNQNAFTTVDSKATLQLFGADGETPWTPASTEADISRFAVEWNAVNYSKETGEGLADKYQLEITSADDKTTDKITFTVAERNVMDEKGTITTKCGEILSVTKEVTIKDTAYTITIPQSEENGRTFYDLTTTVKTDVNGEAVLGEDKTPVLTMNHVTLEGHYELKDASGTPRYKLETFATLEYLDRDGEPGYRVTLPDLVDLLHKDDTRQRITGKVTVRAEGDAEKTTQSEKLELTVPNDGTAAALTLTAEEQPTQDAAAEQSPAAAPPVLRAARVLRATPETAAAEKEELPAVG